MSLTNVLLIHVSSRYMPRNASEEQQERETEYYALLDLPRFAPIAEIRQAYRRLTLKIQCDRMMLEWNITAPEAQSSTAAVEAHEAQREALAQQEAQVKEAFHILGDKHLRQQYHLLQCRPSRYRMIKGPLAVINGLTQSRRWFPLLVLQAVIVATMVNAVVAEYETQEWVYVLIPTFGYYGLIVLFWIYMLELPWRRRHCTRLSFAAMLSAAAQHVCLWNGCFWMARYWDRATGPNITWYILSVPFYLAIVARCHCTMAAVTGLRELQSAMISRARLTEQEQTTIRNEQPAADKEEENDSPLPANYIVVTQDSSYLASHLMKVSWTDEDDLHDKKLMEAARVETSPEFRQVDHCAKSLHRSAVQLAILGTAFVTLVALKLEDALDITWWLIFTPVWIYFGIKLYVTSRAPNRVPPGSTSTTTNTSAGTTNNNNNNNIHPQPTIPDSAVSNLALTTITSPGGSRDPPSTDGPAIQSSNSNNEEAGAGGEADEPPTKTLDVASKSLWKGEYQLAAGDDDNDVVLDSIPTQSMSNDDNAGDIAIEEAASSTRHDHLNGHGPDGTDDEIDAKIMDGEVEQSQADTVELALTAVESEQSLVDSVQLATGERDVEAALPLTTTTKTTGESFATAEKDMEAALPLTTTITTSITVDPTASTGVAVPPPTNQSTTNASGNNEAGASAGHEEFERWQSVYENQEVRSAHFQFIPCEVLFHLLIVCLIVAKLDESYQNTSPQGSAFNAFYILLVPFSVGLIVCCCALLMGFLALNTEPPPATEGDDNLEATHIEANPASDPNSDSDELAPMQAGANEFQPKTFSMHLDVPRPDVTFPHRVQLLTAVLPISTTEAETWLVKNDNTFWRSQRKLWELVVNCANGLNCDTVCQDENIPEIPSFDKESVMLLRENLDAHFHKIRFQTELNAIEPLDDDGNDDDDDDHDDGIECPVCCAEYDIKDMVHCEGDPIHFFCRGCFHRYATETIQSGDGTGMPCAEAHCLSTFATPTVTSNLSKWELLRQRDRENERNQKVALAAKAVLQCTCGAVGIVTEEEVGDGRIQCPGEGCNKEFCALCGNHWHPETSCPPTKKMLQWVVQNTMPCPNCRTPIEKNYGCDHMHCAPPGGCGHHFSYRTGKPMSQHGRTLRGLYH